MDSTSKSVMNKDLLWRFTLFIIISALYAALAFTFIKAAPGFRETFNSFGPSLNFLSSSLIEYPWVFAAISSAVSVTLLIQLIGITWKSWPDKNYIKIILFSVGLFVILIFIILYALYSPIFQMGSPV